MSSNNSNRKIRLIGEGYDDIIRKKIEEEKEKIKKQKENQDLNIFSTKNIFILAIWALLYKLFIKYEFGLV